MNIVRRAFSWLIGRIPDHYRGSALDRFTPEEQQDIMVERFRSPM